MSMATAAHPWKNGGLLQHALDWAEQGIPVFPCSAKNKAPLVEGDRDIDGEPIPNTGGFHKATRDPEQIALWWKRWPTALIGIPTGAASGRFVIDLDRKPGKPDGLLEWPKLLEENSDEEPQTLRCETPSSGQHLYFKFHPGIRNVPLGKLWPGVEVKGEGGYVIAPPSPGYQWLSEAPVIDAPAWLIEKILGLRKVTSLPPREVLHEVPDERLHAYGQAALEEMIEEVRILPKGERSNGLNRIAFRAGQLVGGGCLDLEATGKALEAAAKSWGISSRDKALGPRGTVSRALRDGQKDPKGPSDELPSGVVIDLDAIRRSQEPDEDDEEEPNTSTLQLSSEPFPKHLLQVPGLVGEIAAWITATARYPQPLLSLGAALATVGTAAGRHIAGPTLSGTHLYMIGIAPTGSGKDHAIQQINTIMEAGGMGAHFGPGQFISMPAVINFLKREPLSVCAMDEFGSFLKRVNNKRASGFEGAVSSVLRTVWGSSFRMMVTPEWAGTPAVKIYSPALSIYGVSTVREFFDSLESADIVNGILNRFLLLEGEHDPDEREPLCNPLIVPEEIARELAAIYAKLGGAMNKMAQVKPQYVMLDISPEAETIRIDFVRELQKRSRLNKDHAPFFVRTGEMAIRLATIVTIGQGIDCIEADVMRWARDFAIHSAEAMVQCAERYISDSETQSLAKEVLRICYEDAKWDADGWGKVNRRVILRKLQFKYKRPDLENIFKSLQEAELIVEKRDAPEGRGRPSIYFWLRRR